MFYKSTGSVFYVLQIYRFCGSSMSIQYFYMHRFLANFKSIYIPTYLEKALGFVNSSSNFLAANFTYSDAGIIMPEKPAIRNVDL